MTKPSWQDFATHDESAHPDLWNGVVGYWAPCLGPTGLRLHDVSRYSNWGTLTNMDAASDWVIDDGRYALDLDGSNDRIEAATISIAGQVTISAWLNLDSLAGEMIVNKRPTNTAFNLFVYANAINLRGGSAAGVSFSIVGRTGQWLHIVGTINGTAGTIFLDGESVATGTVAAIGNTTGIIDIGAYGDFGGGYYLDGRIDQISLHNRALTANEIRRLHQLGRGGMLQRRRRRAIYLPQAGFQPAWALRRSQIIGGGLR